MTVYEFSLRREYTLSRTLFPRLGGESTSPHKLHDFSLRRVTLAWARWFVTQNLGSPLERNARAVSELSLCYFHLAEPHSPERKYQTSPLFTHKNTKKTIPKPHSNITKQSKTMHKSYGHYLNLIWPPILWLNITYHTTQIIPLSYSYQGIRYCSTNIQITIFPIHNT